MVVTEEVLLLLIATSKTTLWKLKRRGLPVLPCGQREPNTYDLEAVVQWLMVTGAGPAAQRRRTRAAVLALHREIEARKQIEGNPK